jgi:hypothetical protein
LTQRHEGQRQPEVAERRAMAILSVDEDSVPEPDVGIVSFMA